MDIKHMSSVNLNSFFEPYVDYCDIARCLAWFDSIDKPSWIVMAIGGVYQLLLIASKLIQISYMD
jgi:hypothetical protein